MRVLILTQSYLPVQGGLQQVVHDLARGLVAEGHAVQVVAQRYPRTLPAQEMLDDIPIQRLFFFRPSWEILRQKRLDLFAASLFFRPITFRALAHLVERFQPDVIHFHYPHHLTPFVLALHDRCPTRLIVSFHGVELDEAQRGPIEGRRQLYRLLDAASVVTAVSKDTLDQVITFCPVVKSRGFVVYNGFFNEHGNSMLAYQHRRPYILGVGRLVQPKGFDLLITAFSRILSGGIDLLIAGDGEYRQALEVQAQHVGNDKGVIFLGNVSRAQVGELIRGCRFVVIPSRAETFGLVALEAMALGRRVIATNVGGLPELIEPAENQLVEPNVEAIAQALDMWLSETDFETESPLNHQHAARFTIENMVNGYIRAYNSPVSQ